MNGIACWKRRAARGCREPPRWNMKLELKVIAERHEDGFVAYPAKLKAVIVGQGETASQAVEDLRSAVKFHIETFGAGSLGFDGDTLES